MKAGLSILAVVLGVVVADALPTSPSDQLVVLERHTLVAAVPSGPGLVDETYSAVIGNRGGYGRLDAVNVTAIVETQAPAVAVLDGAVTFGAVRAGATQTSRDTFTIRRPVSVPLNRAQLQWRVTWTPDIIVPEDWAGTWRFELSTFDWDSDALVSRTTTTDIVRPDDALGVALVPEPARCQVSLVADHLELTCQLDVNEPACRMSGRFKLNGVREGDTLRAEGGLWLTAGGLCGPFVAPGRARYEVVATRTSLSTTVPFVSAGTLLEKLLPPLPSFGIIGNPSPSGRR